MGGGSEMECEGEKRDAISRPYLLIMSLYFKVQSAPVMLLHDCASGEFPHRSDDKRMPDSRVAWGSYSLCVTHYELNCDKIYRCLSSNFVLINTQLLTIGPGGGSQVQWDQTHHVDQVKSRYIL